MLQDRDQDEKYISHMLYHMFKISARMTKWAGLIKRRSFFLRYVLVECRMTL
jgi:hypothetical protein